MTSALPDARDKDVRQVAREWRDYWGATWEGDTSDGHHVFRFPNGTEVVMAHSPSAGWAWVKARRAEAAKITGKPFRGKRDALAAKERQRAARDKDRERSEALRDELSTLIAQAVEDRSRTDLERRIRARYRELRKIESLMGASGSDFGRTWHPSVILTRR